MESNAVKQSKFRESKQDKQKERYAKMTPAQRLDVALEISQLCLELARANKGHESDAEPNI